MTFDPTINQSYSIADYFLDGYYIKSEGHFKVHKPEVAEIMVIDMPGEQVKVQAEVMDVIEISEDEYRVILVRV